MNLLADESVDGPIVEQLRQDGNDVLYVAEFDSGITDTEVLDRANQAQALLLTADKDFGELVFRRKLLSARGVVLLRLAGLSSEGKTEVVRKAFDDHGHQFAKAFTVISPERVRVRRK
jgi:predicted nuclease of predicted toxin-antitoxin system